MEPKKTCVNVPSNEESMLKGIAKRSVDRTRCNRIFFRCEEVDVLLTAPVSGGGGGVTIFPNLIVKTRKNS